MRRAVDEEFKPPPITNLLKQFGDEFPVQYVLDLLWWLEEFSILPDPGGINDQDKALMDKIQLLVRARSQVRREYHEWKRLHPDYGKS